MTAYLVACAISAPALLLGLLAAAGWAAVLQVRLADRRIDQLVDQVAPRPAFPLAATCRDLGQCASYLTSDQPFKAPGSNPAGGAS
jgi:hypothetical protein